VVVREINASKRRSLGIKVCKKQWVLSRSQQHTPFAKRLCSQAPSTPIAQHTLLLKTSALCLPKSTAIRAFFSRLLCLPPPLITMLKRILATSTFAPFTSPQNAAQMDPAELKRRQASLSSPMLASLTLSTERGEQDHHVCGITVKDALS
jgi:hypothetical protein